MASFINISRLLKFGARTCTQTFGTYILTKPSHLITNLYDSQICNYSKDPYRKLKNVPRSVPWYQKEPESQKEVQKSTIEEEKLVEDVSKAINEQVAEDKTGRLFAIVHLAGKQFKITESDILVIKGYWAPNPGDQIKLEKVLLVGGTDFTLVGRPILNRELVSIDAVVIEKTMSHTVTEFRFRKRKQYRRIKFFRHQQTMVRINSIKINGHVDKKLEVEGLDRVY
ncbi:large ribosomal subunit protein bL21m isoform X2 [Phymastichus coffea]|uniref:large ribosomal subunit protein bL21m isoform X2 n=1 Tax=Phymastichus coffea TaxID=108790 RepID=UPI00273B740C|nr:large ribosomal subunit protein bL21m isoform X2 [Phymastichus coffea]